MKAGIEQGKPSFNPEVEKSPQRYALLSVWDKTGIEDFARVLDGLGYRIISTGGTAKTLKEVGIPVVPIEQITGNPECFDGRMKTISFQIEGGIIYDRSKLSHVQTAQELKVPKIDIVVCNLYPFEQTVAKPRATLDEAVENIDVGGPTMIRAAAKNFENVLVVVDPRDYEEVGKRLQNDDIAGWLKKELAAKAFYHLSFYDSQIGRYLMRGEGLFLEVLTIPLRKVTGLRYGENPHQEAAFYLEPNTNSPLKDLQRLAGRELSLINLADINAGVESVRLFNPSFEAAAVVIKHNSPCGIALGETASEALARAIEADPESAFGGVIVLNRPMDLATAEVIAAFKDEKRSNIDIVAVPDISENALELLSSVRKSMGIYQLGKIPTLHSGPNIKYVEGGAILQTVDDVEEGQWGWGTVTEATSTNDQWIQMQIAWRFITRIRSNSVIVVDKDLPMTRGIGSGQTSRFRATKIALEQAGKFAEGAILASDSFFPFPDSVELAAKHGITAIVQQGGSVNDQASIDAANKAGIPMIFTNRRAFWH